MELKKVMALNAVGNHKRQTASGVQYEMRRWFSSGGVRGVMFCGHASFSAAQMNARSEVARKLWSYRRELRSFVETVMQRDTAEALPAVGSRLIAEKHIEG